MSENNYKENPFKIPLSVPEKIPAFGEKEIKPKNKKEPAKEKEIVLKPLKRVNTEMLEEIDKAIELIAVEEGIKKRDLINELLQIGLNNRKK